MSTTHSPCAACKCRRQKCTQECIFAPYFPPDDPQKFLNVHKVFGASNVARILNELSPYQREQAVNSLAYEAQYRLHDPIYGCIGLVSILQQQLRQIQQHLECAKGELAAYTGPSEMLPQNHNFGHSTYQTIPQMMFPIGVQEMASDREQEMIRVYVQQQVQHQTDDPGDLVDRMAKVVAMHPSLALSGSYDSETNQQSNPDSHHQHQLEQQQTLGRHYQLQQKQHLV